VMVLADTSIWVAHFRQHNEALAELIDADRLLVHPMVVGELACGTPPRRDQLFSDLEVIQRSHQATVREVVRFIERERLFGRGCGLVDLTLLASTLMTPGAVLWTLDQRLADLAEPLGVLYRPAVH